jgi:Uma2 family endonuclease
MQRRMATVPLDADVGPFAATRFVACDELNDIVVPHSAHTVEGFREWLKSANAPARGQFTFAAGELIIDMSPEAYETHNCIKSEVSAIIYLRVKRHGLGKFFSDRFLLSNPAAGISTEPDATFVTHDSLRAGRCAVVRSERPGVTDELVGSPDWVLEILSRSSLRKDKKLLYDGYFRAGVNEYWLIDALGDEINFQLFVRGSECFVPVESRDGWLDSPIFGCSFQLTRSRAVDGFWEYTLHIQETS